MIDVTRIVLQKNRNKRQKNTYKVYCESDKKRHATLVDEYYLNTHGDEEVMVSNKAGND